MKTAQVIWTTEALIDLEVIYDFLAVKSQPAAQKTVENILARSGQLEKFPESGAMQVILKKSEKTYRYLAEGNYKIIYSYNSNEKVIYIETIFDTRYNPERLEI